MPYFIKLRRWLYLTTALVPWAAYGQGAVQQSGLVTGSDFACWRSNGIIYDCGISALNPLTLPTIVSGHLLGNATGASAAAADTTLTALMDTLATPAQGDLLYRNGTVWTYLAPGTNGQYLKTQGAGANPTWDSPTGPSYSAGSGLTLAGSVFSLTAPVSVANGGLGTTSGTSGGIPSYTSAGVINSSPMLTLHGVMLGGGAGGTPTALTSRGTSGQALLSNGAAADPSWQNINQGTVTNVAAGAGLTGGPITATGTISCALAFSGTNGCVTPSGNSLQFLNGLGNWGAPLVAGTGISFSSGTVAVTSPSLTGTTAAIGGSTLIAACTSGTVTIASATTAMAVAATPVTYPGDSIRWAGYISSAGTATVKVCADVNGTPTSSPYVVRVIQ